MSENEWVKLPGTTPAKLPTGSMLRSDGETILLETEHVFQNWMYVGKHTARGESVHGAFNPSVYADIKLPAGYRFEGSEVVKVEWEPKPGDLITGTEFMSGRPSEGVFAHWGGNGGIAILEVGEALRRETVRLADDLGDTPEHLRELLRAAREKVPGAVICDDHDSSPGIWSAHPSAGTYCDIRIRDAERVAKELNLGTLPRQLLRGYIENGTCYPSADARRIGREEFGLKFYSGGADSIARRLGIDEQTIDRDVAALVLDTRPPCLSCKSRMDERSDGSQLCSAACVQAAQREERDRAAKERHEASERIYAEHRRLRPNVAAQVSIENKERAEYRRKQPPRIAIQAIAPLNPAALPGVAGIRGKRRAKTDAKEQK
jgi:hypothetical protein